MSANGSAAGRMCSPWIWSGRGVSAALPNLCMSEALLAAGRCQRVLSICVEVCSAALYFDDNPGVLISACLFGDGAGAAVLANSPEGKRPVRWKTSGSLLQPESTGTCCASSIRTACCGTS